MKELNELIHKALETKLEDGSFDKILSDYIDKAIKGTLEAMFKKSWHPNEEPHGEAYAFIERTVSPLVMKSLEDCDLQRIAEKTKLAMNAIIEQCSIAQFGNTLTKATGLFGDSEKIEWKQRYSMTKILSAYVKMIEQDYTFDKDWFLEHNFDLDEGCAYLECSMAIEEIEADSWSRLRGKKRVTLRIESLDEDDRDQKFIEFIIYEDYEGEWRIDYMQFKAFGLDELEHMNSVEMLLRKLSSSAAIMTDIADDSESAEFNNLYE